ncbi:sulfotransferase family protein, partial [Acidisphaera rubrifaciens]|uniref:sulfotransferase family protein n=1 Tax=Acidisphaera rubrifaciens TaxID=50715 RepID=UPI0006621E41
RHWTAGHRIIARFQPHDRARLSAHVDASIACFAAPAPPRACNDDSAPVFIVGMPRSGTTLAEQILASHAAVHGAGERAAVHNLVHALTDGWAETAEGVRRLAALDAAALDDAAAGFLAELHALAPGAARVVDKMPGNAKHLGFLARLLPGARFIHCTRDPRDIGLSIFQHRFFGYHPYAHDLGDLGHAIAEHSRLMAHWRGVLGGRLIEVALTDWIEDFDATLARVLDFLGLAHDPACARFHEQGRRVRTASAAQVREPVNARGIGKYRAYAAELRPLLAELERAGLIDAAAADEGAA